MSNESSKFTDEFDKIVSSLQDVKTNGKKIEKVYSTHLDVIVSVLLFVSGITLLMFGTYLQNIWLALGGFFVMFLGGLKSWKTLAESSFMARSIIKHQIIQEQMYKRDVKRFGIRPQGERKRPEDEFWSF